MTKCFLIFYSVILNEVKNLVCINVGVTEILRFALDDINTFNQKAGTCLVRKDSRAFRA